MFSVRHCMLLLITREDVAPLYALECQTLHATQLDVAGLRLWSGLLQVVRACTPPLYAPAFTVDCKFMNVIQTREGDGRRWITLATKNLNLRLVG